MTDPMTPPDCDLRGLAFMPLDVVRLGDSDLVALSTGEEFKAAVMLWCKAWLQVPAASLPDDDRILAHLSGAATRWSKVKAVALRGWVLCSDGRLYHPVVAEKAREAWAFRLRQRERSARGNAIRWASPPESPQPSPRGSPPASPDDRKGQGQGQGHKDTSLRSVSPARGARSDAGFEEFWRLYPRKVGKGQARKAWPRAVAAAGSPQAITDGLRVLLHTLDMREEGRFCPHASTWLNGERWLDHAEPEPDQPKLRLVQ